MAVAEGILVEDVSVAVLLKGDEGVLEKGWCDNLCFIIFHLLSSDNMLGISLQLYIINKIIWKGMEGN